MLGDKFMADIISILSQYGIETFTEGKNTQKGWVNINCPFCDDTGHHGGFNINTKKLYYNCWKCGWISVYDIFTKLNIPYSELKEYRIPINQIKSEKNRKIPNKVIVPGEKTPTKKHIKYIKARNFDIDYLIQKYDIRFTKYLGDYMWRVIFPIYYKNRIVSYQGRDITNHQELRYKACKKEDEITHHKDILYNIDNCNSNRILLVEGIFDVLRIGDNCCCGFGIQITQSQINLLKKYTEVYILFDNEEKAQVQADKVATTLNSSGVYVEIIRQTKNKDPAELSEKEVIYLKSELNLI